MNLESFKKVYRKKRGKTKDMLKPHLLLFSFFTSLLLAVSCSSIDCTLNNLVYTNWMITDPGGKADTLRDTLTISTVKIDASDSVLINRDVNINGFSLPISYSQAEDRFFFELKSSDNSVLYDTVCVAKEDMPHFESVDCGPSFFHKITSVSHTVNAIDSIAINYPDVNYDTSKKHLRIYFNHRD